VLRRRSSVPVIADSKIVMAYPASKRRAAAAGLLDDHEDGVAESVLFPVQPTKVKREAILSPYGVCLLQRSDMEPE